MKTLSELIFYYQQREEQCREGRDRCTRLSASDESVGAWEDQRQIARDTASWLSTLQARGN